MHSRAKSALIINRGRVGWRAVHSPRERASKHAVVAQKSVTFSSTVVPGSDSIMLLMLSFSLSRCSRAHRRRPTIEEGSMTKKKAIAIYLISRLATTCICADEIAREGIEKSIVRAAARRGMQINVWCNGSEG